jgi:hypothetical protein
MNLGYDSEIDWIAIWMEEFNKPNNGFHHQE